MHMISIVEGQEIKSFQHSVKVFQDEDGTLIIYNVINGVEYLLTINDNEIDKANKSGALHIDCKLFAVGTN